ncbi:MAG: 16S rRNA (guanine(966)-N(2))-methyltransferase RsmD [Acidobacteria bacterium]|nr:16S rRNA (guanine(966)-N(2))-methyltransferase RsmD [Acidobacteriota bacterium]
MRVIGGRYRGRVLKSPPDLRVRPTSARLRQALFDVLGTAVEGSVFLDCYAGSGAVGLEAVSRGARHIFFIEESAAASRILSQNVSLLGESPNTTLVRAPVRKALRQLEQREVRADYCFFDPPYRARAETLETLRWLATARLMQLNGLIIVQHERNRPYEEHLSLWCRTRLLAQGSGALSFYRAVPKGSQDFTVVESANVDAPR